MTRFYNINWLITMLGKMYEMLQKWLSGFWRTNPPIEYHHHRSSRTHFLIDDPYIQDNNESQQHLKSEQLAAQLPSNPEQLQNLYRIICQSQNHESQAEEELARETEEFLRDRAAVKEQLRKISSQGANSMPDWSEMRKVEATIELFNNLNICESDEVGFYRSYGREVKDVVDVRYEGERKDYPTISFEEYKTIWELWEVRGAQAERLVEQSKHLKIKDLQLLAYGRWLNDEIISEYINMVKEKLEQSHQYGTRVKVLSSLQVSSFFDAKKYDLKKATRFFDRQGITANDAIIMAVHKRNHWIFLKLERDSLQIYDSILQSDMREYTKFPTISNILLYATSLYGSEPEVRSVRSFPQQRNGYDCGMMMLCGIKDLVRREPEWTFSQKQIKYKRILFAKELLEHDLTGF